MNNLKYMTPDCARKMTSGLKILFIILLFVISQTPIKAQFMVPDWVRQCPGNSFSNLYLCGVGIERDYQTAHEHAFINALRRAENQYEIESISLIDRTTSYNNTRVRITMRGNNFIDNVRLRDTHHIRRLDGNYEVQVLLSIPKPRELHERMPSNTGAFIRSALIPGWGQVYKQRMERGMIFTFICVLSGIFTYSLWSNIHKNDDTHQLALSVSVLTAILHVLNIYDASTISHGIRWY